MKQLFDGRSVEKAPSQLGRFLSVNCWDSAHKMCNNHDCTCVCHDPRGHKVKRDKNPVEQMDIVKEFGTIEIK